MSGSLFIPQGYRPILALQAVESAIKDIKDFFEQNLAAALNLQRVTAPLFVRSGTGINDDLNGVEQPVRFYVKEDGGAPVEIVQSLAKWKRLALARYGFQVGEGLYTDMNAIRPDETIDNIAFDLCRSVGLGEDHYTRRTQRADSEGRRRGDL